MRKSITLCDKCNRRIPHKDPKYCNEDFLFCRDCYDNLKQFHLDLRFHDRVGKYSVRIPYLPIEM